MRIWIIFLASLVAACSEIEQPHLPDEPYVPSEDAVGFTSSNSWEDALTKGDILGADGFENGNSIGVFAFFADNGSWTPENETPNFMYNQAVTLNTSTGEEVWEYSPAKYWSNDPNDKIKFFGYYPHSPNTGDNGIELSANDANGYPTITFTPHAEVDKQIDLLSSTTALTAKTARVELNFAHQLTQVKFAAKVDGPIASVTNVQVMQIKYSFDGVNKCVGRYTDDGFTWDLATAATTTQNYTIGTEQQLKQNITLDTTTYTELTTEAGTMMLIPQKFENEDVTITINYNVRTTFGETLSFEREIKAPAHELLKNKRMVYQFTIELENKYYIRLDAISDEKWNEKELELELDDMFFNLTGNTRAYNWVDHTTGAERLTIGIGYETNLPATAIKVEKVVATPDGELRLDTDESMIFYTRDNIQESPTDRLKITLTFGDRTRILYIDIEKKDMIIEFTVTVEPWDDEIIDVEDLIIKFDVEIEEWENATGDNIFDGIIDVE